MNRAMKKIMFNDKYGLTEAVLKGRKTMTRRIVPQSILDYYLNEAEDPTIIDAAKYEIGEVVAISQSYKHIYCYEPLKSLSEEYSSWFLRQRGLTDTKGWKNKMFVKAEYMPHHLRIVNIKVERLQDISDEDVYKEGFTHEFVNNNWGNAARHEEAILTYYDKKGLTRQIRDRAPKEAFSYLIDKVSGIGTWERNPWVFAYEFELID